MQEVLERKSIKNLDFNCDLAQSYGFYKNNNEYELLDYVSSVSISCGFHAGDPVSIKEALLKAKEKNVAIGAHIGFNDIQGFGYRPVELKEDELEALVVYQVGAIISFAKAYGLNIEHVRPHGAMYKMASESFTFSVSLANAIKKCSEWLFYVAPVGDISDKVADYTGIKIAREISLEKSYNSDLTVDYSAQDNTNNYELIKKFQHLLHTSQIKNNNGGMSFVNVDTIHFSNKYRNSIDLIKQAKDLISPSPINYNSVKSSGWVD
ncbi:MAG: LamB/YcsF family protein [bacterium]|nr:LamB/YcsF family protein [bacterium]